MKNNAFSYVEMVCALIVITGLVTLSLYFLRPKFSKAKKDTFINQANTIAKAAISKYIADSNDDESIYPDDLYNHETGNDEYFGKVCYSLESLKDKYLKKVVDEYQGSVEVCTLSTCDYKTKIWLSNDEYYLDGIKDNVNRKDLTKSVFGINHCGNIYN